MKLTPKQQEAYPYIKWLLGSKLRAEGKTYLLAKIFIDLAVESPGKAISVFDHHETGSYVMRKFMFKTIFIIIKRDPDYANHDFRFDSQNLSITLDRIRC